MNFKLILFLLLFYSCGVKKYPQIPNGTQIQAWEDEIYNVKRKSKLNSDKIDMIKYEEMSRP